MPYIVRQCLEEIERRGMEEVGIYRVSGVATDIQALKTAFDTSEYTLQVSCNKVKMCFISFVTCKHVSVTIFLLTSLVCMCWNFMKEFLLLFLLDLVDLF